MMMIHCCAFADCASSTSKTETYHYLVCAPIHRGTKGTKLGIGWGPSHFLKVPEEDQCPDCLRILVEQTIQKMARMP